jgi:hypothetical protein
VMLTSVIDGDRVLEYGYHFGVSEDGSRMCDELRGERFEVIMMARGAVGEKKSEDVLQTDIEQKHEQRLTCTILTHRLDTLPHGVCNRIQVRAPSCFDLFADLCPPISS